jgi:hypothetical protein
MIFPANGTPSHCQQRSHSVNLFPWHHLAINPDTTDQRSPRNSQNNCLRAQALPPNRSLAGRARNFGETRRAWRIGRIDFDNAFRLG